ncbi:MAG: 30S ribosomal protein S2, partial [Patescibacteria group bacterium]
ESQQVGGEFEKYTKFEVLKLQEKIKKLRKDLSGLVNLKRLPEAIWVSSANYDKIAVKEAVKKNVPVVGLVNTNADPTLLGYPIPANDNAINAVSFILKLVGETLGNVEITAPVELEAVNLKKDDKNGKD